MSPINGKVVMLIDAREGSEVQTVAFEINNEVPLRTRRRLRSNLSAGTNTYENIYFTDGPEGLGLLVDPDDEAHAEADADNLEEFFDLVLSRPAMRVEPIGRRIDFIISLVDA